MAIVPSAPNVTNPGGNADVLVVSFLARLFDFRFIIVIVCTFNDDARVVNDIISFDLA